MDSAIQHLNNPGLMIEALIYKHILLTIFSRKCMKISLENLYLDIILRLKGLNLCSKILCRSEKTIFCVHFQIVPQWVELSLHLYSKSSEHVHPYSPFYLSFKCSYLHNTVYCVRIPRSVWGAPLRAPTPLQSILCPIIDPILVTFGQICNFRDPNLVTFYLCIYLMLKEERFTFHLQCKLSGTFANRKCEELSYPPPPPKKRNVRPHSSNSIENATTL